eukprot:gene8587-biopygen22642
MERPAPQAPKGPAPNQNRGPGASPGAGSAAYSFFFKRRGEHERDLRGTISYVGDSDVLIQGETLATPASGENGSGRGPDAGRTIDFEETDADRTRTGRGWQFSPGTFDHKTPDHGLTSTPVSAAPWSPCSRYEHQVVTCRGTLARAWRGHGAGLACDPREKCPTKDAPGTRPGRVHFFKFDRAGGVRAAPGARPLPFLPNSTTRVWSKPPTHSPTTGVSLVPPGERETMLQPGFWRFWGVGELQ